MFDNDDLFDLTDDPFEWDLLLDDDELEQDRKKRQGKNAQSDASKKKDKRRRENEAFLKLWNPTKSRRGLFGGLFG